MNANKESITIDLRTNLRFLHAGYRSGHRDGGLRRIALDGGSQRSEEEDEGCAKQIKAEKPDLLVVKLRGFGRCLGEHL